MKKRLRKKKHIGEFREDGFYIKAQLSFDIEPIFAELTYVLLLA